MRHFTSLSYKISYACKIKISFLPIARKRLGVCMIIIGMMGSLYGQNTVSPAPLKTDHHLQVALKKLLSGFHGRAGVYVEHLKTGKIAAVNADTIFPTASVMSQIL